MPYLSVVIPAYNTEKTIERCLKAIRQSEYNDYELIVVDDGSQDQTTTIAKKYADKVIEHQKNLGRNYARISGVQACQGEIIVNVDSDIVIKPDTLSKIADYFYKNPAIDALTGLLSKEHPNPNFFSQYKNLYMHYIFKKLPERVTFLYGSIYAIRRMIMQACTVNVKVADDTSLGQQLFSTGKQIAFLNELEVIHLKKYNLLSFIKNDFQVSFDWAKIFLKFKGWQQLGRYKTGFLHSPKEQLMSVVLASLIFLMLFIGIFNYSFIPAILFLILIWFLFNIRFFAFLARERKILFVILAFFTTLLDNVVMASGILCGFTSSMLSAIRLHMRKNQF